MIANWIKQFMSASPQTRYFILNWAFYGIVIVATTFYCYGRLDYVRSYRTPQLKQTQEQTNTPKT